MEIKCILVGIAGVILGAAAQYVFLIHLWPNRHKTYTWIFAFRNHKKLGAPCKTDLVLDRDGYSLGYSFERKSALWASYVISKGSIGIDVDRSQDFDPDPDIPEEYRVQPDDFRNTGYDKGHQAPSAAIDFSRKSNDQTFLMSNIVLQDPKLNRQAWGRLEGMIRSWTHTKGKLLVITGPLYGDSPELVNDIPVPERFYKIVYSFEHERAIGFIFPNEPVKGSQIWEHAMSVEEVENETGYQFFDKLGKRGQKIKAELDVSWWEKK